MDFVECKMFKMAPNVWDSSKFTFSHNLNLAMQSRKKHTVIEREINVCKISKYDIMEQTETGNGTRAK